jgi:hypothetical protein
MNITQLESFNLADAIKFHDKLNPLLWDKSEHLHPEIKEQLLAIAADFGTFLGIDNLNLKDITISGSNAAFSYTPHSDIDLHLIVDLGDEEHKDIFRELFDAKKFIYNTEHKITIKGIPVELYVQDANQEHHSQGVYSILNNDWLQIPKRRHADVDDMSVRSKYKDLSKRIREAIKSKSVEQMNAVMEKIRDIRGAGLANHGEFGAENLAFKLLRNKGDLKKLHNARKAAKSAELSLKERIRPTVNYGYGKDYLDEVGLTPDGTNPSTCEFANEEKLDEVGLTPDGTNPSTSQFTNESGTDTDVVNDFAQFCVTNLRLESPVRLRLKKDPTWSERNKTFGRYNGETNELEVSLAGRHIMDVLRTIAHELTHQRQHEREAVPDHAGKTGSEYENEANARAGILMREYGRAHPELFMSVDLNEATQNPWIEIGFSIRSDDLWPAKMFESTNPKESTDFNTWLNNYKKDLPEPKKYNKCILAMPNQTASDIIIFYGIAEYIGETNTHYILKIDSGTHNYSKNNQLLFASQKDFEDFKLVLKIKYAESNIDIKKMPVMETKLNEATGYIPTAAEANDPRFEMALTVDIKPGAIGKNANKLLLNTDSQGHPQELRPDGVVQRMMNEYLEFKNEN